MTKINVPTKLDREMFEIAGCATKSISFSDQQLGESIAVLKCVIRYFVGRGDCDIILQQLRIELSVLDNFRERRSLKEFNYV